MKPAVVSFAIVCLLAVGSIYATADCTPPANPGAVICFPTPNATVSYPMNVEGAATGDNLPIIKMILYSDNVKVYEVDNQSSFVLQEAHIFYNGSHHLVLNAWDSGGHLFQASEYVKQVADEYNVKFCAPPYPGIRICTPLSNTYHPNMFALVVTGSNNIQNYNGYINGKLFLQQQGQNVDDVSAFGSITGSPFSLVMKGYDKYGHVYKDSSTFYLYYLYNCGKDSCSPGVIIHSPGNYEDAISPFTVNAETYEPKHPITAMKVYLDNTVVASSTGPTVYATVSASKGTHLLTVQGWDSTGALYKQQQTVNVY